MNEFAYCLLVGLSDLFSRALTHSNNKTVSSRPAIRLIFFPSNYSLIKSVFRFASVINQVHIFVYARVRVVEKRKKK